MCTVMEMFVPCLEMGVSVDMVKLKEKELRSM
jgi:hypothetical protein